MSFTAIKPTGQLMLSADASAINTTVYAFDKTSGPAIGHAASDASWSIYGNVTEAIDSYGSGLVKGTAQTDAIYLQSPSYIPTIATDTIPFTKLFVFKASDDVVLFCNGIQDPANFTYDSGGQYIVVNSQRLVFNKDQIVELAKSTSGTLTLNDVHCAGVSYDGTTVSLAIDGVAQGTFNSPSTFVSSGFSGLGAAGKAAPFGAATFYWYSHQPAATSIDALAILTANPYVTVQPAIPNLTLTGAGTGPTGYATSLRVGTDNPLTGSQSEIVTLSDAAGGTFSPTSITLNAANNFGFVTYMPSANLGLRTVTATANGMPSMSNKTLAFTVTALVPASALILTGPSSTTSGYQVTFVVTTNQPLVGAQTETVTLSDNSTGIFGTTAVTLSASAPSVSVSYTAAGVTGARTITATSAGTPTLTAAVQSLSVNAAVPVLVAGINTYTIGVGRQFNDLGAFANFINGKNLPAVGANAIAQVFDNETLNGINFTPVVDDQHTLVLTAAPGFGYQDTATQGMFDYPNLGVELTIGSNGVLLIRGASMNNFRIKFSDSGQIQFGNNYGGVVGMFNKNRVLSANPNPTANFSAGNYSSPINCHNNVFIRTAGGGPLFNHGDSNGDFVGNTIIARGTATSAGIAFGVYGGAGAIQDNAFINCGPVPIGGMTSNSTASSYKNNYTNMPMDASQTVMTTGMISDTVNPFVQNIASDLRASTGLIGKGNSLVISTNDGAVQNRGISPDAGALQYMPAQPLSVLTVTSQLLQGQALTISGTTLNNPISASITLATATNTLPAFPVTIGTGTFTVTIPAIVPGIYIAPVLQSTNSGGTFTSGIANAFTIIGITGNPQALQNTGPSSTYTVSGPASGVNGVASDVFTIASNGYLINDDIVTITSSVSSDVIVPNSVTLSSNALYGTFTIIPSSLAVRTLTFTNSGGLTNVTALAYTSVAPAISVISAVTIAPPVASGSQQFVATVVGVNTPSPSIKWATTAGSVDNTGAFTAPPALAGVQTITVTATSVQDSSKSTSAIVTIPADLTAPTISLMSSSTNVSTAGSYTLSAAAADNIGVAYVEFYRDGVLVFTKNAAPFTLQETVASSNNGQRVYFAKAYDAAGNSASSASVAVIISIAGIAVIRSITGTLLDGLGAPLGNLNSLRVAVFAETTINSLGTPIYETLGVSTNQFGVFNMSFNSTLAIGTAVTFAVSNGDGTITQNPPARSFIGTVILT